MIPHIPYLFEGFRIIYFGIDFGKLVAVENTEKMLTH